MQKDAVMFRFISLLLLFSISLLCIFNAPAYYLWLIAILVTEFPFWFIVAGLILLVIKTKNDKYRYAGSFIGIIAISLFLSPIVQAAYLAQNLGENINKAFAKADPDKNHAFSIPGMLSHINTKKAKAKCFSFAKFKNTDLHLSFFTSVKPGIRPCVVVIHGGSWKSGDNDQLPELNAFLAGEGYHVASMEYRLAPEFKFPSQVKDVKLAMNFLKKNAAALKIDTLRFVLLGRSAGAQIALLAAYTGSNENIKGVIDYYGPADMVWGYSVPANPLVMNSRQVMEDYLGGRYKDIPEQYKNSSPLNWVSKSSPPTLIIHGKNDVLVAYEHSVRLHKKLDQAGVRNFFLSLPWATHGFDYNINGPGGQLSTFAVRKFLKFVTE